MPVNSQDFFSAAKDSIERHDEIGYRCAISRAYYAMFHHALRSLRNAPVGGASAHQELINYLLSADAVRLESPAERGDLRKLASLLLQRRMLRNYADYDLSYSFAEMDACLAIEAAKVFFEQCEKVVGDFKGAEPAQG